MIWNPYREMSSRIAESAIPFPHRKWREEHSKAHELDVTRWIDGEKSMAKHMSWTRKFYSYTVPHTSKYLSDLNIFRHE